MSDVVLLLRALRLQDMNDNQLGQLDMTSINQIRDAFKEAGWTPPATYSLGLDATTKPLQSELNGRVWYDRFKIEFAKDESVSFNGDLLAVARRAAGLPETDTAVITTASTDSSQAEGSQNVTNNPS